mgnify:CR=1 FL=1
MFLYGAFGLIKNKRPNIFSLKMIGFYLILIGLLVFCHVDYVTKNNGDIVQTFNSTIEQLLNVFGNNLDPNGGGIIGAVFALLFVKLFSVKGTVIVSIFLIICGLILMFNVSIISLLKNLFSKLKNLSFKREFKKQGIVVNMEEDNEDEVEDLTSKKVITSLDELDEYKEEPKTEENVEVIDYNDITTNANSNYILPDFRKLLKKSSKANNNENKLVIKENVEKLEKVLSDFKQSGFISWMLRGSG